MLNRYRTKRSIIVFSIALALTYCLVGSGFTATIATPFSAIKVKESAVIGTTYKIDPAHEVIKAAAFGVVCDGTNETARLQAAIDAAAALNGAAVELPRGVCWVRNLELKSRVDLISNMGSAASKLRFYPSGDPSADATSYVIRWTGAYGSIRGITIDGQYGGRAFSVGNGIYIAQGTDGTYSREISNVRVEFFAGYKSSPTGGPYGLRQEFAANDIRNPDTGEHLLTGGNGVIVSDDEGYASNLVINGLIVNRVDGFGLDIGRANDSKIMNVQIGGAMRVGLAARRGNKNIHWDGIKVFLCRRLNISNTAAPVDVVPYFGTGATDPLGGVLLTGTAHEGTIESQENGSHGFRLGTTLHGFFSSDVELTADGNGGYVVGASAGDLADYRRYGIVLENYYDVKIRLTADDLRSKHGVNRQARGIFVGSPASYSSLGSLELGGWYKISDNSGGADFTPLQVGYASPSNTVGTIFQAREPSIGAGLTKSTNFGTGSLVSVHDGLTLVATIVNQYEQDQGTGSGWNLNNDDGATSRYTINGTSFSRSYIGESMIGTDYVFSARQRGDGYARVGLQADGKLRFGSGTSNPDIGVYRLSSSEAGTDYADSWRCGGGKWNSGHLTMGTYHLWIDSTGRLRIKNGSPIADTDGNIIGQQ